MKVTNLLAWFEASSVSVFMHVPWIWPLFETLHFIGLCALFGSLAVLDLRLIGVFPDVPLHSALKFASIAIAGFILNLLTGVSFFIAEPYNYFFNSAFHIKMVLLVLAGINTAWFAYERRNVARLPEDADVKWKMKFIAGLSLVFWTGVIVAGRVIPFVHTD